MPPLDLKRADSCARAAHERLGRKLPPSYPANPIDAYRANLGSQRGWGIVTRVAEAAEQLLERAAVLELEARAAQELAVEALRSCGGASPSWDRIGTLIGISGQAAHKRYADVAARPRAELTIDDELEPATR